MKSDSTNLPASRVQVIGRDAELDFIVSRLLAAPGRLVTITGAGGVGKTTLAYAAARQALASFVHGGWVVELASVAAPADIVKAIAGALGLRDASEMPIGAALASFLRDRDILILVDNCEHLLDACAEAVGELLDDAPGLRILATSREALHLPGEVTYALQPLAVPSANTTGVDALLGHPSVALFVERAQAARLDFVLTARNAPLVAEICSRLDGIPLAIELAAARLSGLPLQEIASRLSSSFDLLIARGRSRPERHQTLRATLAWSHESLDPMERVVFRRLGAFAGGWAMPAAEFVCSGEGIRAEDVTDLVTGLVEKSLVVLVDQGDEPRYRFLEPVREYAQGRSAASGEAARTRDRHRAFFVTFAERAGPEMHRAHQAEWARKIDGEMDNLRAAIRSAHSQSDADGAFRIAGSLWWFLWVRGHLREGLAWVEPVLDEAPEASAARISGLAAAAMMLGSLGRSDEAVARAEEMLNLARDADDAAETARGSTLLAMEVLRRGEYKLARPLFEQALISARKANHAMFTGQGLVNLGQVVRMCGEPERAEELYREGLALFELEGDLWGVAYAANNISCLVRDRGEYAAAVALSHQATRVLSRLGDRFYLIFAVEDLARAVAGTGRSELTARLFGAAQELRRATGALLPPGGQDEREAELVALRASLGASTFAAAWADGETRPFDLVVNEVTMREEPAGSISADAQGGPGGALTAREREVARLLAAGRTNRQIAQTLVITPGTAGVHVEHILRKLELQSRHQVADWARSHGLGDD